MNAAQPQNETLNLHSLSRIAVTIGATVGEVEEIAAALGIRPHLRLNTSPYFNEAAFRRISVEHRCRVNLAQSND